MALHLHNGREENVATTWSINALAGELGLDRRTLTRRLQDVRPAEVSGRMKRYRLSLFLDYD